MEGLLQYIWKLNFAFLPFLPAGRASVRPAGPKITFGFLRLLVCMVYIFVRPHVNITGAIIDQLHAGKSMHGMYDVTSGCSFAIAARKVL